MMYYIWRENMSSFIFENKGTNTYLVYAISESDSLDTMNLGMLTNNKIPGLATTIFTQADTNKYLKYNVSAKITAKQFLTGPVNKKRIIGVFSGIVDAMLSAEDYMISQNTLLLDLDYVFSDVSTCETVMICLPLLREETQTADLGNFFRNIMFSTQFDQTESCDYVAKIINYLNSTPVFSLTDFKNLLNEIKNEKKDNIEKNQPTQTVIKQNVTVTNPQPPVQTQQSVVQKPVQNVPKQTIPQPVKQQQQTIPPAPVPSAQKMSPGQQQGEPEKKITMFGLLMHYSKENKALYNAQKAAKKASISQGAQNTIPPKNNKVKNNTSFNIPNTTSQVGFAIPGQTAPAPQVQTQIRPKDQSQSVNIPQSQVNQQPKVVPAVSQPVQPTYVSPQTTQGQSENFGETTVLGGGGIGETTVLGVSTQEKQITPHLIRTKNNERINLSKPVFRIGKERSYVDYFVSDNTAVSRSHANIITRDDKYFIVDTNSTNHTYVNGGMIQSNVETPLSHGTKIRLANEDFEFRLY